MLKNKTNIKQFLSVIFLTAIFITSITENNCLAKNLNEIQNITTTKIDKIMSTSKDKYSSDKTGATKEVAEDIVEVIVEDKPLEIPKDFQTLLQKMGVTSIVLGDKQGKARLLSIEGAYINPCIGRSAAMQGKPNKTVTPCRFQAGLGEALSFTSNRALMSLGNGCDSCLGRGISRICNVNTNKWNCSASTKKCDRGHPCGD
jgi:hypothetical protein